MKNAFVLLVLASCLTCGLAAAATTTSTNNFLKHTFSAGSAVQMWTKRDTIDGELPVQINVTADQVATCGGQFSNGGRYYGIRGIIVDGSNNNYLFVLYDVNGVAAGIQMTTPRSDVDTTGYHYDRNPVFQQETRDGITYFVITVYFTANPRDLCVGGRTDFGSSGTASTLRLQNGPNPDDASQLVIGHHNRADALASGIYTNNKCFPGMGDHTFTRVNTWQGTNCQDVQPLFLLHGKNGTLIGFGLAITGFAKSNKTLYEKPPKTVIKTILGDAPQCVLDLAENNKLTTLHILFTKTPYNCDIGITTLVDKFNEGIQKFLDDIRGLLSYFGSLCWWSCPSSS